LRALLFHCKEYRVKIGKLANRPNGIIPEEVKSKTESIKNCVLIFTTIEKADTIKQVNELVFEITKMALEVKENKIVILPFAHLSNNLGGTETSIKLLDSICKKLEANFKISRAHFGSHKELLFHLYGHPGNARYREF